MTGTQFDVGTSITYACTSPTPANFVGTNPIRCSAPGVYTPSVYSCETVCINVPQIVGANGNTISGIKWSVGTAAVTYTCVATFSPTFSTNDCQAALTWSQTTGPTCLKECGAPPAPNTGVIATTTADPISGKNVEGKVITYGCGVSTTALRGTATNTCQNNGQWTLPLT
uniref:Sushi domain-containing protein n=1 Tax=Ciona savignyi TaxID=51511 RepID=H2YQN6_CIOSA